MHSSRLVRTLPLVVLSCVVALPAFALDEAHSVARQWDDALLDAIRIDLPRPTVHGRNLLHVSIAMYDAWAAYDDEAALYLTTERATASDIAAARNEAISYAAYRILRTRFAASIGAATSLSRFDARMAALGYDKDITSTTGSSPAAFGNRIAAAVLAFGQADGANEAFGYADTSGYQPVNQPLIVKLPGTTLADPNRWQPLSLDFFVTQNGIPLPIRVQTSLTPHWGGVTPFVLERATPEDPYTWTPVDPGTPPLLGGAGDARFKQSFVDLIRFSSWLDGDDGAMIDISPGAIGNNPLGTNDGTGYPLNPATGQPYAPNMVRRGDWARVLTEYWADGPDSETPPGHWNTVANYVSDHPLLEKRIGGTGPIVDDLEWDVKLYLAINGAVHDAAIAGWGAKRVYDTVRPISAIRYMAGLGQSSEPGGTSYHPDGLPLIPGLIELITEETIAPGGRHAHLVESATQTHVGEIALYAWGGNPTDPRTQTAGAKWILGSKWVPYQLPTFVSPAFPGYVSGHSTFSRAGAEVMTRYTGSPYFPGGLGVFVAPAGTFLRVEDGPTETITMQWATYQDAADGAGLSRLAGGIHPEFDDFGGRILGSKIGPLAYEKAARYWNGTAPTPTPSSTPVETPTATPTERPLAQNPRCDINQDGFIDELDLLELQRDWHRFSQSAP